MSLCVYTNRHTHAPPQNCFVPTQLQGIFPNWSFSTCSTSLKEGAEFLHFPGPANHLTQEREKQHLCGSISTRTQRQSGAATTEKHSETPSRAPPLPCAHFTLPALLPGLGVRSRLRRLTKKGCGSLPTSRVVCCQVRNTALETGPRFQPGQPGSQHRTSDITERGGERLEGTWEVLA